MSMNRTLIASCVMLATMFATAYFKQVKDASIKKPLSNFPLQIGEWSGTIAHFDPEVYRILGVDDSILCNYKTPDGRDIQLYVGFYKSQREGDMIHSPKNCLPGAGWRITEDALEQLPASNPNTDGPKVNKLIIEKDGAKQIVLYWYQSQGRIITSEYMQKVYLVTDSLFKHRTDGSFIRLIAPISKENEQDELRVMREFILLIEPILNQFIPS